MNSVSIPKKVWVNTLWKRTDWNDAPLRRFHFSQDCARNRVSGFRGSGLTKNKDKAIRWMWISMAIVRGMMPCKMCCKITLKEIVDGFNEKSRKWKIQSIDGRRLFEMKMIGGKR